MSTLPFNLRLILKLCNEPPTQIAYIIGIGLTMLFRINSIFQGLKYPTHPTPRAGGEGGLGVGVGVGGGGI